MLAPIMSGSAVCSVLRSPLVAVLAFSYHRPSTPPPFWPTRSVACALMRSRACFSRLSSYPLLLAPWQPWHPCFKAYQLWPFLKMWPAHGVSQSPSRSATPSPLFPAEMYKLLPYLPKPPSLFHARLFSSLCTLIVLVTSGNCLQDD